MAAQLVGKAGHQQDLQVRKIARRRQRQRDAVHDRHLDVGQQQVERAALAGQDVERFGAVLGGDGFVAVHGDGARHQRAHRILVVGDQYPRHCFRLIRERGRRIASGVAAGEIPLVEEAYINITPFGRRRGQPRLEIGFFARL